MFKKSFIGLLLSFAVSVSAYAACSFDNKLPLKSLTNSFEAWKAVTEAMSECGNLQAELDQEFRKKQPQGFAAKPSLYHIGGVTNSTIVPLLNEGTIRSLDALVKKYGKSLKPNQLVKYDGKIMAIAMMVNNQHFMYRKDIFAKLELSAPKTYEDVLKAADKIKNSGLIDYPLGGTYKTGWNLAEEFINMYLGLDGKFFGKSGRPTLNNKKGVRALETMKKLTEYMDPEYLVADSTYVQKQFQQGKIAMANLWATRAAAMDDEKESKVIGKVKMSIAPSAKRGGKPASSLWWDGVVIAKNITDAEAEAAFRMVMEGIDSEMVKANNDSAVWLVKGYQSNALSEGAIATAEAGAYGYPASSRMSILHTALGNNIADYLTGKKSARKTLKAIQKAYIVAAKEKGIM